MESIAEAVENMGHRTAELASLFAENLPGLLGALLLLLAGWLLARLARSAAWRFGDRLNRSLDRLLRTDRTARLRVSPALVRLAGNVAFWVIVLFFVTLAAELAGFKSVTAWLSGIVAFLPTLFFGVLIILAGYLIGLLVRDLLADALASANIPQRELIARLAQAATFLTAIVLGIHQVGIDVTFITTIIGVVVGTVLLGFSIAFGLGARGLVANLIGLRYVKRYLEPGSRTRICNIEGEILEFTPVGVVVATREGRTHIPARLFNDEVSVLMTPGDRDD